MKKKILFPFIWFVFLPISMVLSFLFPISFIFSIPVILVVNPLAASLGWPADTTFLVFFGTLVQAFLLGCLWDFIVEKVKQLSQASTNHSPE